MNQALTLQTIAEQVQELLQAETVVVMLAESSGEQVYHAAAVGKYATNIVGKRGDAATSGLPGIVFKGSCPVLVENTKGDPRVRQDTAQTWGIKSALAIPLFFQGQLWGALMALNRLDAESFTEQDQQKLVKYGATISDYLPLSQHSESTS
ncbi:GAF domain-containing protein [Planktothrix mougeotii]|uniref:GAF domain-containing protein n=1 Tax=Planktothrix mougeotii LEGE 06226 TaxID=1828728 RepID=A0ABR9UIM2_9CYAN|nr:GAF domain-containing protein [Planktothrix mougeotii]MBE9146292.1 GAF domain-containing protein [Planktothrix mougeotii LEGE 06226]